jgi:hypothetical protein
LWSICIAQKTKGDELKRKISKFVQNKTRVAATHVAIDIAHRSRDLSVLQFTIEEQQSGFPIKWGSASSKFVAKKYYKLHLAKEAELVPNLHKQQHSRVFLLDFNNLGKKRVAQCV